MATKSIGASGFDYATVALWEDFVDSVNGTGVLTENEIGQINNEELISTATTAFAGSTPGVFNIILEAQSGDSFRDNANKLTNALRYNSANGASWRMTTLNDRMVTIDDENVIFRNLMFSKDTDYGGVLEILNTGLATTLDSCIFHGKGDGAEVLKLRGAIVSNVLVQCEAPGSASTFGIKISSGATTIVNTTVVRATTQNAEVGISRDYDDTTLINVAVLGYATDYSGTFHANSSHCATDKATIGGTNLDDNQQVSMVGSTEFESVSATTGDWRLKSTSVKCKNNGTATGTPTPPSVDIVGTSRSGSTDIGVWEFSSGGPTTYPISATATGPHSPIVQRSTTLSAMASSVKHSQTFASLKVVLLSLSTFGAHVATAAFTVAIPVVALATAVFRPSVQRQGNLVKSTFGAHVTPTLALTSVIKGITTDIVTNVHVQTIRRSASLNYQVIKSAVVTSSLSAFATIQISVTATVGHLVTLTRLAELSLFVRNVYDQAVSFSVTLGGPRVYAVVVSTMAVFTGQLASITNRVRRPFSGGAGLGIHMRIRRHFRPWRRR